MTENQQVACHTIIHGAATSAAAIGGGMAQLPMADNLAITPLQIAMIIALGKVFDVEVTEGVAKGVVLSLGAAAVGRGLSQILVGWIPGFGNAINATTAATLTEAIGWAAVKRFERGDLR